MVRAIARFEGRESDDRRGGAGGWLSGVVAGGVSIGKRSVPPLTSLIVISHLPGRSSGARGGGTVRAWVDRDDLRGPAFRGSGRTLETPR